MVEPRGPCCPWRPRPMIDLWVQPGFLPGYVRLERSVQPLEEVQDIERQVRCRPTAELARHIVDPVDPANQVAVLVLSECPDCVRSTGRCRHLSSPRDGAREPCLGALPAITIDRRQRVRQSRESLPAGSRGPRWTCQVAVQPTGVAVAEVVATHDRPLVRPS